MGLRELQRRWRCRHRGVAYRLAATLVRWGELECAHKPFPGYVLQWRVKTDD